MQKDSLMCICITSFGSFYFYSTRKAGIRLKNEPGSVLTGQQHWCLPCWSYCCATQSFFPEKEQISCCSQPALHEVCPTVCWESVLYKCSYSCFRKTKANTSIIHCYCTKRLRMLQQLVLTSVFWGQAESWIADLGFELIISITWRNFGTFVFVLFHSSLSIVLIQSAVLHTLSIIKGADTLHRNSNHKPVSTLKEVCKELYTLG